MGRGFFHSIDELFLPNWGQEDCPWCWELNRLKNLPDRAAITPAMRRRYLALERTASGLSGGLFLHWSSRGALKTALRLGPRSIFGERLSDVELFVSVASAMQTLRSSGELSEHYVTPLARVLSPTFYLRGRYYDAIITAAILRCGARHDLRSTMTDAKLISALTQRLRERASVELRSEILLAIAQGKLPKVPFGEEDRDFWRGEPGVCAFLRSLLLRTG